ncbi:MAG: Nif3-like dinuclear metal center hexameric protein [Desulfosarcina sp.]|jgi:dinuclear metal center YbgI/SA1388 family protein
MTATVAHMMRLLDQLAPPHLAESWDNVGLQIGNRNWPVKKVWTALDPLPEVVAKACENHVNLLITHHPLFFKPTARIDCQSPLGRVVETALSSKLAILCAHTNLDSVPNGVNDVLAGRMGLEDLVVLGEPADVGLSKLVVFVPATHVRAVLKSLFAEEAGRVGNYTCCSFRCEGVGTFLPGVGSEPTVGKVGTLTEVRENRIEVLTDNADLLIDAIRKVHPYETMACDVYPLNARDRRTGLGRVGKLASPLPLDLFVQHIRSALKLPSVKVAGDTQWPVEKVAVCSGSGSSLLNAAIASGAQAYVSGDLGYHTAREAQQAGIGLVDIGHFGSEHIIVDVLAKAMRDLVAAAGMSVVVEANDMETDPFYYL